MGDLGSCLYNNHKVPLPFCWHSWCHTACFTWQLSDLTRAQLLQVRLLSPSTSEKLQAQPAACIWAATSSPGLCLGWGLHYAVVVVPSSAKDCGLWLVTITTVWSTGLKGYLCPCCPPSSTDSLLFAQAHHSGPQALGKQMNTSLLCHSILSRQLLSLCSQLHFSHPLSPSTSRQAASWGTKQDTDTQHTPVLAPPGVLLRMQPLMLLLVPSCSLFSL